MDIKNILKRVFLTAVPVMFAVFIFTGSVFARKAWEFINGVMCGRAVVAVVAGYALVSVLVVVWIVLVRKDRKFESYLSLALLSAILAGIVINMKYPDEKIHLGEFGLIAPITYFAFRSGLGLRGEKLFLVTFLFCSFVGIFDEVVQYFVPMRVCDPNDMLTNILSSSIGLFLTKLCFIPDES